MSNKLKRKPTRHERENSTWASAVKSFFLEFFLNSEYSPNYYSYEEHLTKEGKRKKTILWSWFVIVTGIVIGSIPFYYPNTTEAMRRADLFLLIVAAGLIIGGIVVIVRHRTPKTRKKKRQ